MKKLRLHHFISGIAAKVFAIGIFFSAHVYSLHKFYEIPFLVQRVV